MKSIARKLRQTQTPSEKRLWSCLRNHGVNGLGFRRQQPIGPYIVDFCCFQKKLVIEIDGGIHSEPEVVEQDRYRQAYLEALGYRVLRYTVEEVMENLEGVVVEIARFGQA